MPCGKSANKTDSPTIQQEGCFTQHWRHHITLDQQNCNGDNAVHDLAQHFAILLNEHNRLWNKWLSYSSAGLEAVTH